MKNQIFFLSILIFCFACKKENRQPENKPSKTEPSVAAKSYTGQPLDRFEKEIQNFEQADAKRTVVENEVLFIGSSSIRMWSTLAEDFDPIPVLNRGFGGSTLPEVIHYADRILFSYQPQLIVLYCGENDIADGASPEQVLESFKKLDAMIDKRLPNAQMIYVAMKPSVSRVDHWSKYQAGDQMIQEYIKQKDQRHFIDCSPMMLTESGLPDSTIFIEDMLHMNSKGYAGWKEMIRPKVEELF